MFGLLIASRPVLGPPESLSPTQYAFTIPSHPRFSHLGVFLLPGVSFPADNVGATVWFSLGGAEFQFLGALSPGKPSAIFRLSDAMADAMAGASAGGGAEGGPEQNVVIGISIESAEQVEAQVSKAAMAATNDPTKPGVLVKAGQGQQTQNVMTTKLLAQRIIGNAFNFLSSFNGDTVPLKAFRDWWDKFEQKVTLDPGFLEREQD